MTKVFTPADTVGWVRNQIQQRLAALTKEESEIINAQIANDREIQMLERKITFYNGANDELGEKLFDLRAEIAAYRKELNRQFQVGLDASRADG